MSNAQNTTKGKRYSDWTADEKAAYKAKREAYWKKRTEDTVAAFANLEKELVALKAKPEVLALLAAVKKGVYLPGKDGNGQRSEKVSYLEQMFGTETPKAGQVATYLYIGVRGPNGERMNEGETMGQFVTRCGDCSYKYDSNTIASMVWYLKKKGHEVTNDRKKATVTYVKYVEPKPEAPAAPKAELIKAVK